MHNVGSAAIGASQVSDTSGKYRSRSAATAFKNQDPRTTAISKDIRPAALSGLVAETIDGESVAAKCKACYEHVFITIFSGPE